MNIEKQTRVDDIVQLVKNQNWTAPFIVIAIIVVSLGTFTDSLSKLSVFLRGFHDPQKAELMKKATELHTELLSLYKKYRDHPAMQMDIEEFKYQDSSVPVRFFELYHAIGIPESEFDQMKEVVYLHDYLWENYLIPTGDPKEFFSDISFFIVCLGPQRDKKIEDLDFEDGVHENGYNDHYSRNIYAKALLTEPTTKAGDYAHNMMDKITNSYFMYKEFIDYFGELDFSIDRMSPQEFRSQDSEIAKEFNDVFIHIENEFPSVLNNDLSSFDEINEKVDYYLLVLEQFSDK